MIETALMLPFLMGFTFNVINFGYFFVMAVNMAAAPRTGGLYSIIGPSTPSNPLLPPASAVDTLTRGDLTNAVYSGNTAPVQVCTVPNGTQVVSGKLVTQCTQYNSSPTYSVAADPEQPTFVANQVDVTYTFNPLINRSMFNLFLLGAAPYCSSSGGVVSCTFHRKVVMRAMN